jgi:hypothetical protein
VVAFYPGCVYAESDLPLVYPHIYTDNDYLAFRSDKVRTTQSDTQAAWHRLEAFLSSHALRLANRC